MVRLEPFEVERWMDTYEVTPGVLNVAETCVSSISVDELVRLSTDKQASSPIDTSIKLTYGAILGSEVLRELVADAVSGGTAVPLGSDDIIITQGAISANFLALYSLVGQGDHVICVYPTYQQLYSVPESLGAEVSLWRLRESNGYVPDIKELDELVKENTKASNNLHNPNPPCDTYLQFQWQMIIINNPNNPTGVPIPTKVLTELAEFAKKRDIILFSDEVYRPLFHAGIKNNPDMPPTAAALGYDKVIVTGSMSKAYALAGIRVGWVVSRDKKIIEILASARDYTTISVSQLDDQVARFALSPAVRAPLLERNISLANHNAMILGAFVQSHSSVCSWLAPTAGTTAFIQFRNGGKPVDDAAFCRDLLKKTKVLLVAGSLCFGQGQDFSGYVRVGFVCATEVLEEALKRLSEYVAKELSP